MTDKKLEEGQIVMCIVTKIVGTVVFVKIEEYDQEGTITFSEISPGRIRNIREYAFPGKKIVCKVIRIKPQGIDLSLRRVKLKEKNDVQETERREKSFIALIKTIAKDKTEKVIKEIKDKENSLSEFMENAKENQNVLEKYFKKEEAERINSILREKKEKENEIKKGFSLSTKSPAGINIIKKVIERSLSELKDKYKEVPEVNYIAAGKYLIKIKTKSLKQGDNQLNEIVDKIESISKKEACFFARERN